MIPDDDLRARLREADTSPDARPDDRFLDDLFGRLRSERDRSRRRQVIQGRVRTLSGIAAAIAVTVVGLAVFGDRLRGIGTPTAGPSAGPSLPGGWTEVTLPDAVGATLRGVGSSAEQGYTVVGARAGDEGPIGAVWNSLDGRSWTAQPALDASVVEAVVPTFEGVIAAGNACAGTTCVGLVVWRAQSADRWRPEPGVPATAANVIVRAIGAANPTVAVGDAPDAGSGAGLAGQVWTDQGGFWVPVADLATFSGWRLVSVAAGPHGFAIVGSSPSGDPASAIWHSSDGLTWGRQVEDPDLSGATITAIASGSDGFIAVGSMAGRGAIWTSTDGSQWSKTDGDYGTGLTAVGTDVTAVGTSPVWVAGTDGTSPRVWHSTDGVAFVPAPPLLDATGVVIHSIAVARDGVALVGRPAGSETGGRLWLAGSR